MDHTKHPAQHLAIVVQPFLDLILKQQKTIETRFSKVKCAPFQKVKTGDVILLKQSGGYEKLIRILKRIAERGLFFPDNSARYSQVTSSRQLYQERVLGDNYTPKEVSDVLKGTVHNKNSVVSSGNPIQYQELNAVGASSGKRGVVGAHRDTNQVFVKTAYKTNPSGIKEGEVLSSPKLTGEQKALLSRSLTDNSITQNGNVVNREKLFIDALSDNDKVRRLKNAVMAGEKGIHEQADDLLNRMIALEAGLKYYMF